MRFSCEKCWDNPCTCGHEQREGDKLRAEFAGTFPPLIERSRRTGRTEASTQALELELTELQGLSAIVHQLMQMRHLTDERYWLMFSMVALAKAHLAQVKVSVELAGNKPIVVTLPAAETLRLRPIAEATEDVTTFARRLIQAAEAANDFATGEFNSFTLCAWPGATVTQVLASWNERQKASYFGGDR